MGAMHADCRHMHLPIAIDGCVLLFQRRSFYRSLISTGPFSALTLAHCLEISGSGLA